MTEADAVLLFRFMHLARDTIAQDGGIGEVVQLGPYSFAVASRDGTWFEVAVRVIPDPHSNPAL